MALGSLFAKAGGCSTRVGLTSWLFLLSLSLSLFDNSKGGVENEGLNFERLNCLVSPPWPQYDQV